jgi:hypothetical protein
MTHDGKPQLVIFECLVLYISTALLVGVGELYKKEASINGNFTFSHCMCVENHTS